MKSIMNGFYLGISPISWRNEDVVELGGDTDYRRILSEVALAGYQGTEAGSYFPKAADLNAEVAIRKLQVGGQWFSSFIIRDGIAKALQDFEKHCQYLSEIHASFTVLSEQTNSIQRQTDKNIFADKPYFTDAEWEELCAGLNEYGRIAHKYGVQIAYHHHLGTGVQTSEEVDRLMSNTDADLVGLLLDTGHAVVSDGSYLPILKKYAKRINYLHLKDVHQKKETLFRKRGFSFKEAILNDMFTVPGQGDIDFRPLFDFIIKKKYQGWVMVDAEINPNHVNPLEMAQSAHSFITKNLKDEIN